MSILIRNVSALTLDSAGTILRGTNIAIEGGTILSIGDVPPDFQADETIDGSSHAALPGFFNAHCHSPMTLLRGWAEDLPLDRWFNDRIWIAESGVTSDDVYWGAALAACEMIRSGCVGFNDLYFHMDRVAEVVAQSGMKASLAWGLFGVGSDVERDLQVALDFTERWQGEASKRIRTILGPHSPYICPPDFLQRVGEIARQRNLPVHIHLAESREQLENSLKRYGRTPTAHLEALGIFDGSCIAAHALYLTDEDISILARHAVSVAHCPITYMKLAMGVNNVTQLIEAGVKVGIGTDGAASNGDMDMKAAVRFTTLLQKHQTRNAEVLRGDTPLRMATAEGASFAGFPDSGMLTEGMAADIVLVNLDAPHLYPRLDLVANLVHSARGSDVSHVIVDGRVLYREGELLTLDEEKIKAEAELRAQRLVRQNLGPMLPYEG